MATSLFSSSLFVPGPLSLEHTLCLQEEIKGSIPLQNDSDEVITVRVSLADYLFNANRETSFPSPGTCPRSNHTWIDIVQGEVRVAPHSTYPLSYTVKVPKDPSLFGTYWSIVLIEPLAEKPKEPTQKQSLGVQTIIRYGVQIVAHVETGKGAYALKVLSKSLRKEDSKRFFSLAVENTGTLMQAPSLVLELVDTKGQKAGRFEASKQKIFPSCSVLYEVDLSSLSPGSYKAMAILDHGDEALFGAKYDLEIN